MRNRLSSFFTAMFFRPSDENAGNPADHGFRYEDIVIPGPEGVPLAGFFIHPPQQPRGTVVFCHGNSGNISTQHVFGHLFVRLGFQVAVFDYRGYGKSPGSPTPDGIVEDAICALDYVLQRPDVDPGQIILFGQSLGGAAAAGAMAKRPQIKALILEGTFSTYRAMAWQTKRGRFFFFLTNWVISDQGPLRDVERLQDRPLLIIHGRQDDLIPASFGKEIFDHAKTSRKHLTFLRDLGHLDGDELPDYEKAITRFLNQYFPENQK